MREFMNKKGQTLFLLEEDYVSSMIIWLNERGYKEIFHNG